MCIRFRPTQSSWQWRCWMQFESWTSWESWYAHSWCTHVQYIKFDQVSRHFYPNPCGISTVESHCSEVCSSTVFRWSSDSLYLPSASQSNHILLAGTVYTWTSLKCGDGFICQWRWTDSDLLALFPLLCSGPVRISQGVSPVGLALQRGETMPSDTLSNTVR